MAETQFSSGEKEQVDEWTVETVEVKVLLTLVISTCPEGKK
jgi:hypothetical protein